MTPAAPPRDAATVAVVREGKNPTGNLEVLLLVRPDRAHFAPRAEVFPGGSVDQGDRDPAWRSLWTEPELAALDTRSPLEIRVAAVRETFEESGILLADPLSPRTRLTAERLEAERSSWRGGGEGSFLQLCRRIGVRPWAPKLAFFAHWLTPEGFQRRFDTRFFLAPLPAGQAPRADPLGESGRWRWADPARTLEEARMGERQLLPPTREVLGLLAEASGPADALGRAGRAAVETRRPRAEDLTSERFPGLDRSRLERDG